VRRLEVAAEAQTELFEATLWYEQEQPGLGTRFEGAIDELLARLASFPFQFPEVRPGVRRGLTRTFPYAVYFQLREDSVRVVAILHQRRDPKRWRRRA
jgi:toxin ParE1/3/4